MIICDRKDCGKEALRYEVKVDRVGESPDIGRIFFREVHLCPDHTEYLLATIRTST